jgi:hypothetical protein
MIGLPIANKDFFDGLRTTTPIVSVCSDSQPKTFWMPFGQVPEPLPVAIDMSEITFTKKRDALVSLA